MKKTIYPFITALLSLLLVTSAISISTAPIKNDSLSHSASANDFIYSSSISSGLPNAITVTDANPFYVLMATPLAIHYNEGSQHVVPLYVQNFSNPSKAVLRAEQQIGIYSDFTIGSFLPPKEMSLFIAASFWQQSSTALVFKNDQQGYNLGMVATPLSSYLHAPVIITDTIDAKVTSVLHNLSVETLYLCGDLSTDEFTTVDLTSVNQIIDVTTTIIDKRFGQVPNYITLTNPQDTMEPIVLDTVTYPSFKGTIASTAFLPTQALSTALRGTSKQHTFTVPQDYKYARITLDVHNIDYEHVEALGDEVVFFLSSPDEYKFYGGTMGGIPFTDESGEIIDDRIHFETVMYDSPGEYTVKLFGKWFSQKTGSYEVSVTVEKLNSPIDPLMNGLSSLAPYLTAYHKGIIFAKPEFAFSADDDVLYNGKICSGNTQPGANPKLIIPSNNHTYAIQQSLNQLLFNLSGIPQQNIAQLRNYYKDHPIYIAIAADPTMIPMYFYYNPDGKPEEKGPYIMGFALPSDFIYGDIDPDPTDMENDTLSYWPFQENIVGRVTGRDAQDASALIARTIHYETIIQRLKDWKDNALVSTGCGLEFQNLPVLTRLSHLLYGGRGEPTKFPTGESTFINLRINDVMQKGFSNAKSTFTLASQREGFSKEELDLIKNAGFLNKLLFPKHFIYQLDSKTKVTGGTDQMNSNLIFTFAHGSYNLFEHGDVLMDARGFPLITPITRIYPTIRSGLSHKGSFDVRAVDTMKYGPSVMFVVSCITGRTDGIIPENAISQAFLHAGVNAYIGATRVTADPGYLEPRPLPGGWGIGTLGILKATLDLLIKNEYPTFHFGAVIGEDFITELIEKDATTGLALRNAKNLFMPKDANSTFYWTPPLTIRTGYPEIDAHLFDTAPDSMPKQLFEETRVLDKKYVAFHEFTLYGDPAFNPYQTMN